MSTAVALGTWEDRTAAQWLRAWQLPELGLFERTGSTNDLLRERALAGAPAGTVIIADHQSAGRGRLGRVWEAPPGHALLCSVLLRPLGGPPEAGGALPLRVGLALADAIEACASIRVSLKWPNDVLAEDRKLAGILCEASADFVVVGIGINVAQREAQLPHTDPPATSLELAAARPVDRAHLAGALFDALRPLFRTDRRELDATEIARYATRDALLHRAVCVDGRPVGHARGVDRRGALLLEHNGSIRPLHAGTVRICP